MSGTPPPRARASLPVVESAAPDVELDPLVALPCTLPPAGADRRRIETGALFSQATRCVWLADGARLSFDGSDDTARALLDFVLVERSCCSQLSYELAFSPPHDGAALTVRGPESLLDAIRGWVGAPR